MQGAVNLQLPLLAAFGREGEYQAEFAVFVGPLNLGVTELAGDILAIHFEFEDGSQGFRMIVGTFGHKVPFSVDGRHRVRERGQAKQEQHQAGESGHEARIANARAKLGEVSMPPSTFEDFYGNASVARTLAAMLARQRIPQTMLFGGVEGVGKATLVRRFAAALLGGGDKIEQDDLSLRANQAAIAERQKWTSEQRNEDPLFFGSHPDFLTFPPDGPLQQTSIEQMRLLKERAQYQPLAGKHRVFLIDRIDRANEHAANSLLKVLEEPPAHLILVLTALNPYDLLPTIRSRSVLFHFATLSNSEMRAFAERRGLQDTDRRIALSGGSPGMAASMDLDEYDQRRLAMLTLLKVAAGRAPFSDWAKFSETLSARKQEKLDLFLDMLYHLLDDVLLLMQRTGEIRNEDLRNELEALANRLSVSWIRAAVARCDELSTLVRRNIQKSIALDAFAISFRNLALQKA